MHGCVIADLIMDKCPRCGADAVFVGYEDARTFYQCEECKRVWPTIVAPLQSGGRTPVRVLVADDSDLLVGLLASWLEGEGDAVGAGVTRRQAPHPPPLPPPPPLRPDFFIPPLDRFQASAKLPPPPP